MPSENYRVTISSLNIREMPTTASRVLGQLHKDDLVEKLAESEDNKWIELINNGVQGWSSKRYLSKVPYIPPDGEDFPWMAVAEAEREKGIYEIPGSENSTRVLEYLQSTSNLDRASRSKDETPWCSAFVNWCVKQAGYEGTDSALARSWMTWGHPIDIPRKGCIVVFSRETKFGHVGFFIGETATHIKVLGGNQQNLETKKFEVSEKEYPKSEWLGYRIP